MSPIDPRTLTSTQVGTRLRDAAVDPNPGDFLPPTNAGVTGALGNPHGPTVISPGLHGDESVRPIVPGDVSDDPAVQEAAETASVYAAQPQTDPLVSLTITGATTVVAGATLALTATVVRTNTGSAAVTPAATWTTSDATKATVSSAGVVTGVAAGAVTITATYRGGSDTHAVTVTAA